MTAVFAASVVTPTAVGKQAQVVERAGRFRVLDGPTEWAPREA
jgi:hypothetical protein